MNFFKKKKEIELSDDDVFSLSKVLYREMKSNFDENYIGDKDKLERFMSECVVPLYPAKRNLQNAGENEDNTQQSSNYNEKEVKKIDQKPVLAKSNIQPPQHLLSYEQQSTYTEEIKDEVQKYSFRELCLYIGIGNFLCCKSYPPDPVYEDLGLGICLYLKFMKHFVYTLLILSILPIMQIVFFYSIAASNNFQPASNYQNTLFAFSIGTLSLQGIKCSHQPLNKTKSYGFGLTCPIGEVRVLGPVYSANTMVSLSTCKEDINLWIAKGKQFIQDSTFTSTTTCNTLQSNCTYNITLSSQSTQFSDLSVTFQCINGKSRLGGIEISRSTALICSIIFDLIFIVGMTIFFMSQTIAESKEKSWFKAKQLMLDQFTVQVGYFNMNNFFQEFQLFLSHLKQLMLDNSLNPSVTKQKDILQHIVQVRLPDNTQFLTIQGKRKQCYKQIYQLIGEIFLDSGRDPEMYLDTEDFITQAFKSTKKFGKYKKKLTKILQKYIKLYKDLNLKAQTKQKVYIVFDKPKYKRYVLQSTVMIKGERYLQLQREDQSQSTANNIQQIGYQQASQEMKRKYVVSQPPAPAVVVWGNVNKTNKLLRNIFSWFITILLVGVTYILIAFMLWQQKTLLKNYNFNIECQTLYPSNPYNPFNQALYDASPQAYTHCFCLSSAILLFINKESQCSQWSKNYSLFIMIPIIFSIGIVIINAIISLIYRALSKFEAHDYLTSQLYSYIVKKSLLLILNLALIIIVLSIDTSSANTANASALSFLFQGTYNDITADWYLQVGLIITLSMIFNMISPFVDVIVFFILTIVKKIMLKLFHGKPRHEKTKQNLMSFYRQEYFPIEQRYALILAVLTIILCLNCVFPLMTIILLFTLFFLQLNDKVLIIKAFQKPINFNDQLHSKFMKTLLVILLLHLVVTALLITQPFLLVAGVPTLQGSITQVNRNRFEAFFNTGYIVPYALLFVVILICVCVNFGSQLYLRTKPNPRVTLGLDGVPYQEQKFYHLLNKYELRRTFALKKKQINTLELMDSFYRRNQLSNQNNQFDEFKSPVIDSASNFIDKQNNFNDNNQSRNEPSASGDNLLLGGLLQKSQKSILLTIAKHNLHKLQNKLKQNQQDKQRLVKLTGMTVYDWNQDWVFFNQYPKPSFEIKELSQTIKNINFEVSDQHQQMVT